MTPQDPMGERQPEEQDAFLRGVLRLVQWVEQNTRAVTIGAVVLILVIAAGLYYRNYRQDVRRQAASQLQTLQTQLQSESPSDTLRRSIQEFVSRYGDTRYGDEGRLLMGRIHLNRNEWEPAISSLQPVVREYPPDSPTGYAARKLLAAAQDGAGNPERALSLYGELAEGAQFPFQRNEARASRARLLTERGRLEQAERILAGLVQEADTAAAGTATEDLQRYRVQLGELRARLAAGDTSATGLGASDTSAGAPDGG